MPKYEYKCLKCGGSFSIRHGIKESAPPCGKCSGSLKKVLTPFRQVKKKANDSAGKRVRNFIEETKEEIQKDKEEMTKDSKK